MSISNGLGISNGLKKILLITIIALFIITVVILFLRGDEDAWLCENGQWVKHGNPGAPMPTELCEKKRIANITNFEECIEAGNPIMESYPRQCRAGDQTFTEDTGNEFEKMNLIRVSSPRPNQVIKSPLAIEGEARGFWFFEASFPIKFFDENNNLLGTGLAQAESDWMTENFVKFKAVLSYVAEKAGSGTLVLEKDNPSGLPENADELKIPVKYEAGVEGMTVKAYFNNSNMDPEFSCNKVFPVERLVPKTQAVGRAALGELLKGVTESEKNAGFFTSINSGVKIQILTIENGIAKVDFDERLEFQAGGSCRVAAIRAEITETLKQFPTVKDIIISINGRTEDILQP